MELEPSFAIVDENVPNAIKEPALVTKASKKVAKAATTTDSKFNTAISWKDPQMKKILVGLVFRHRAYMPTTTSYAQKFDAIAYDLMINYPPFKSFGKIEGEALNKQFQDIQRGIV